MEHFNYILFSVCKKKKKEKEKESNHKNLKNLKHKSCELIYIQIQIQIFHVEILVAITQFSIGFSVINNKSTLVKEWVVFLWLFYFSFDHTMYNV